MIDWFVYVKEQLSDEKWPAFKAVTDKIGLTTLSKVAARIGQLYFGLDEGITWCNDVDEGVCADMMDFIFRSGNFGVKDRKNIKVCSSLPEDSLLDGLENQFSGKWKDFRFQKSHPIISTNAAVSRSSEKTSSSVPSLPDAAYLSQQDR